MEIKLKNVSILQMKNAKYLYLIDLIKLQTQVIKLNTEADQELK